MYAEPSTALPPYLARYATLGFDSDDVAALVSAIDSSQTIQTTSLVQLPAELLLRVLEYVPIDYILEWRAVCRGFRDAIDGRILFHHLQRTELIGFMGTQDVYPMERLDDDQYDEIFLLRAHFHHIEDTLHSGKDSKKVKPIWNGTYAVFQIDDSWYQAFRRIAGAEDGDTVEDADTKWLNTLDRLELRRPEEGYGSLRWSIKLDAAVLDLDFPLEAGRNTFDVDVHLHRKTVRVAWKAMLVSFLKTEALLRQVTKEKESSVFTFSHSEDCLRAVRRRRLNSTLNLDNKVDRHIKWSLRLLQPLFGKPSHDHTLALVDVEDTATNLLMLLRREAGMTGRQKAYLHQLKEDHQTMETEIQKLEEEFKEFKAHFSASGIEFTLPSFTPTDFRLPRNPVAWTDDQRATIDERVAKWRSQKRVITQVHALLSASNQALAVPADSFDDLGSEL